MKNSYEGKLEWENKNIKKTDDEEEECLIRQISHEWFNTQ